MKVAFKNTIFWCWIWALIHTNYFYNLELVEFKACSAPTCISIPVSNFGWFFQKISITFNLGQTVETKQKFYFSVKKFISPQINAVCKVLRFWQQNFPRFNVDIGGKGENLEFEKLSHFLNLLNFKLFFQQVLSRIVVKVQLELARILAASSFNKFWNTKIWSKWTKI